MLRIFFFIISVLLLQNSFGQNPARLAQADSLYNLGVQLYHEEKYEEAIQIFERSKAIDLEELDSLDLRINYLNIWMASCYFKKGDIEKAVLYDECGYNLPPIDRRLMAKPDSIKCSISENEGPNLIKQKLEEIYQLEYAALGGESRMTLGTRMVLAIYTMMLDSPQKAKAQVRQILNDCDNLYGANSRIKKYLLIDAIQYIYSSGTINDVSEGCNELFIVLEKNGESESEFALNIWKNLASAYVQAGMTDEYEQVTKRLLSLASKLYGNTDERYILLLVDIAQTNNSMKFFDLSLQHARSAEKLAIKKDGRYCELHLLALLCKTNTFSGQGKFNKAKKIVKTIIRKVDVTTKNGQDILSGSLSYSLMLSTITGKFDKRMFKEVSEARQRIADTYGKDNDIYCVMSTSLLSTLVTTTTDTLRAIKLADEEYSLFEKRKMFEPLFLSSFAYLAGNYYVKSRKASSAALEILNNNLNKRYAGPVVQNSSNYIDAGLSVINTKLETIRYSYLADDTIRYSLSMIKQNLLQAKLLILEHSDSLGTNSFLTYLKDFACVAVKDTKDQLMADSIVNMFCRRTKEKFGEESQEFQEVSKIMDIARFEKEYPSLAWRVQHYKNRDSHYWDSIYNEAVAEYNQTFELWKKGELKEAYSPPPTPSIWTVIRQRNFQEAFIEYEKAFDSKLHHWGLELSDAIPLGICADSLGKPSLFMDKMKEWREVLTKDKYADIGKWGKLLAAVRLHADDTTYESYEQEILDLVNGNDKLKLQISTTLQIINPIDYWGKTIYKQSLIASFHRLEQFLEILESRKGEEEMFPMYAAVLYARNMTLYDDDYFYGYSRDSLMDTFKQIYELLSENPELYDYQESYDVICMLCDIAYDKEDYQLVTAADQLRRKIKATLAQNQEERHLIYTATNTFFSKDFPEYKKEHLETQISLAYYSIGKNKTNDEVYEDLVAAWNEIRTIQQQNFFSSADLEKKIRRLSDDITHAMIVNRSDSIKRLAYDFALFSKGYMLRSEQELIKVLKESGNRTVLKQYEDYLQMKRKLDDTTLPLEELKQLKKECDDRLSDLRRSSKTFDDYTQSLEACWSDVQNALDDDEIAIEYVEDKWGSYYVLILKKGYDAPIVDWVGSIEESFKELGDSIYLTHTSIWPELIMIDKKFINPLEGVRNIYFSPTGILHQIAMESIPGSLTNDTLMCEKYNLYRVSNTREIIKHKNILKKVKTDLQKAALFGGMEYYVDDHVWEEIALKNLNKDKEPMYAMRDNPVFERGAVFYLEPLPGTNNEVKKIASILSSNDWKVSTYTKTHATEDEFKRTSGSDVTVLHLATHGFYQTSEEIKDSATITFVREDDNKEEQALSRSGLFMTGASAWFYGETIPENVNDGILTAREISYLDLTNVDMVVLSACETGLGEITEEGIFGLQRGFKKAGVNSIIMSLWEVDDEATSVLMTEFYRHWIEEGKTKRESLELAQQTVCSHKEKGWNNPKYWAAFILLDGLN